MSTEPLIRELFRNLEGNLHERLVMIEQILNAVEKPKVPLYDNEFVGRIEALERSQQRPVEAEERFAALEEAMTKMYVELESLKRHRPAEVIAPAVAPAVAKAPVVAPVVAKAPVVAPAVAKAPVVAPAVAPAVAKAPAAAKEATPPQWEEDEVEVEVEVDEEEVEVDEEEVEEEALELDEFEYKGRTFYKDQNNLVYAIDEEGEVVTDEPIGQWNGKRIVAVPT